MNPPRPNILLITTDQQRWDALGINGNHAIDTPNLDAMAASGVNFRRAYSTCPVCIPARRTLISGLSPTSHGLRKYQDGLSFDPPHTLPGVLSAHGWQTQLVGKLHLHPQRKRYGFDHMVLSETSNYRPTSLDQPHNDYATWLRAQGIDHHPHFHGINGNGRIARPHPLEEAYHQSTWLAREAASFLTERRDPSCPWFLHLSFFHPHPPLTPPRDYFDKYLRRLDRLPETIMGNWAGDVGKARAGINADSAIGPFDEEEIAIARAAYYALINHIDDCVAHVLERYCEYGNPRAREPIWILFSSDHGEMLGDHHLFRKSLPYEGSAHIPFFLSGRNVELTPGSSDALVCWEDVMPTLLDLAGVPIPEGLDGQSLAATVSGNAAPQREALVVECGGPFAHQSVLTGPWKYIWWAKHGEEQLFHMLEDPEERHDRSGEIDLTPFRQRIAEHLRERDDYMFDEAQLRPLAGATPSGFRSS